ncbi:hypothetical protein Tco_1581800, partial [Tanacetum coccineum]
MLTSDSLDDSKGVSSKGPSITSIPKEGSSIARLSKEPILKVIFKSPTLIKGCVLGLANVETWDNIMKKFRMRTPRRCADKLKGEKKGLMLKEKSAR